ncbi:MAG: sensor histidine kinase, partial [Solirubrobacteraceae bacterium]
ALKVAIVTTVLIALFYVGVAAVIDAYAARRVLWEVDQRLASRLSVVSNLPDPLSSKTIPDDVGTDGAPVFVWWVSPSGSTTALTVGAPALPGAAPVAASTPLSAPLRDGDEFRFKAVRYRGGVLIAAQDLAGPSHIDQVLLIGELVLGPVLLVGVFSGVLLIGLRAAAPAESARRRLQELTADASHELRTPLTVIEAEIELARSGPPDPLADREALHHVARESRRLKSIVEDLLWLARFDAEPARPPDERADIAAVARSGAARFEAVASARGITLLTDAQQAWVEAPPEWLERLTGTLLDNGCRYASAGGTVRIASEARGNRAVLCVEDDGPGVPEDQRSLLFDRFHRSSDVPGGAGLGLAIADSVVRSTAGRWRVERSSLGGARFEVAWRRSAPPAVAGQVDVPVTSPA